MKKIVQGIFCVGLLCAMLVCVMVLVPLERQVSSDYDVTLYDLGSNNKLQDMKAHVFGRYEYYLFHINSRCRFEGQIEITTDNGKTTVYENVIIDLNDGIGGFYVIEEGGVSNTIGNFIETKNPMKKGKILLSQPYENSYVIYKR